MALARRFMLFVVVAAILSVAAWVRLQSYGPATRIELKRPQHSASPHPIDHLIKASETEFKKLLETEAKDLAAAAQAYRDRRGRHPPPGFDAWFKFAQEHGGLMIEALFDQIHHDLNPYWGVEPSRIRRDAKHLGETTVSVRNHKCEYRSDENRPRMINWHEMTASMEQYLPDVDLPMNVMDESRVTVQWETISKHMKAEASSRKMPNASDVITEYKGLKALDEEPVEDPPLEWERKGPFWEISRRGCAPDSPARTAPLITDFSGPPPPSAANKGFMYQGYVSNWTMAKDPCDQPELQALHGTFIEPISIASTDKLVPLFGGSKLPMNNEILVPPAFYWADDELYSGGKTHGGAWDKKHNKIIWRGVASGGRNHKENWTRFHRHRFLSMINGTAVRMVEEGSKALRSFELPPLQDYPQLKMHREGSIGDWLDAYVDAGFTNLWCFPDEAPPGCAYTNDYYAVKPKMPMKEQYEFKYLPDIDGNSYSGRYRAFLFSTSLPIKATIYSEWHDSRLLPWVHFVPMDNSFVNFYAIMDYFLGDEDGRDSHDDVARYIAESGKAWADKVLRKEDMQIYLFRLILEFARLCDDNRERLGFVGDIL